MTAVSLLAGFILVGVLAGVALAAWDATCNVGEACVWKHSPYLVPLAARSDGDPDYENNNYPNTQENMNDSVSSIKNRFNVKDVVFHFDENYGGTAFCLNAGWSSSQLNSHNDEYSSHLIAVGSTC